MIEDEARSLVGSLVGNEGLRRLDYLRDLVVAENSRQNLIAKSTIDQMWNRHILDSIQLIALAGRSDGRWLDIGTGGGFPGLAIAAVSDRPVVLVEPRRLRADFLRRTGDALGLSNVEVRQCSIAAVDTPAAIISARAVAAVEKLLQGARRCATPSTKWLLLRGTMQREELNALRSRHADKVFHVEQSLSDPSSAVLVIGSGTTR